MPKVRVRSRLRFSEFKEIDGISFWDLAQYVVPEEQPDDLTHEVRSYERIDQISFRYYGDPILWFVIALANDMEIVPTDLNQGAILRIPSPRYILENYFQSPRVQF